MLILVGPSASGKTQAGVELIKKYNMVKFVTYTSRAKRVGEVDGVDYHFLSKEEFEKRISEDFFLEHVFYNNNYYGTSFSDISSDKLVILEPKGLKTYVDKIKDKVKVVYLKCDKDVLKKRMINRGDEIETIIKRLALDEIVFTSDLESLADLVIDTTNLSIDDVTKIIFNFYKEYMYAKN